MRIRAVGAGLIVALIVAAVAGGAWWWLDREHTRDAGARAVVAAFAAGYSARDLGAVRFVEPGAAASFTATFAGMGDAPVVATVGTLTRTEARAEAPVSVSWTLPDRTVWRYSVPVHVVERGGTWAVAAPDRGSTWDPAITRGDTVAIHRVDGARGNLLDRGGDALMPEGTVYPVQIDPARATVATVRQLEPLVGEPAGSLVAKLRAAQKSGSKAPIPVITFRESDFTRLRGRLDALIGVIYPKTTQPLAQTRAFGQPLLGSYGEVTAELVKASGGRYAAGDRAGVSGLQRQYDSTLAGTPAYTVVSGTGTVLLDALPVDGEDVQTTLDRGIQASAEDALRGAGDVPAALVAVDIPTGGILAVANSPWNGFDRALAGRYAPGSAFKVATTYAYLTGGVTTPSTSVACPPSVVVNGKSFGNYEGESLGNPTFGDDFAHSCNTAFIGLAGRLAPAQLTTDARALGVGGGWASTLGVDGAFAGSVPQTNGATDQAAAAIGQGRIEVSPVSLAVMVGSIARGSFITPTLVTPSEASGEDGTGSPTALDAGATKDIRALMRRVVTEGTGTVLRGTPGGPVAGKTGTAEFGTATPPQTRAWFVGYQGDVAFAVLVEEGASGGSVAAPIARAFLTDLAR
jgi:cell division protein FtsI/penicillin-binding protein 2